MQEFAPVLIITLCRYHHLKRCVESLARCTHAAETDLFVALDYPAKDSHWEGYRLIESFLPTVTGFRSVTVWKRSENYGALKNYFVSKKELFQLHECLIFSEDDNEFSPNFLQYINLGLKKYREDPKIYAVCGYNYPVTMPDYYAQPSYLCQTFSAWGYGTWRDRVRDEYYSAETIFRFLLNPSRVLAVYRMAPQKLLTMLLMIKDDLPLYGDGVVSLENISKGTFCVFPTLSKVRNHGHDGTGVHCGTLEQNPFSSQHIDVAASFTCREEDTVVPSDECIHVVQRHFALSMRQMLKCWLLIPVVMFLFTYRRIFNMSKTS